MEESRVREVHCIVDEMIKEKTELGRIRYACELYAIRPMLLTDLIDSIIDIKKKKFDVAELLTWFVLRGYKDEVTSFISEITMRVPLYVEDIADILSKSEIQEKLLTYLGFKYDSEIGTWINPSINKEDYKNGDGFTYDLDAYYADAAPYAL